MTAQRGGPVPHLLRQVPAIVKAVEGERMFELVVGQGATIRAAAAAVGLSATTGWRRYWWYRDWTLPGHHGLPAGPLPPMRGTRACPRGRPFLPTLDRLDGSAHRPPPVRRWRGIPVTDWGDIAWTTGDIARRLGLSRERCRQLTHRPDFPQPAGSLSGARAWAADDIDQWIAEHRPGDG